MANIIGVTVNFHTTVDDKDREEAVTISLRDPYATIIGSVTLGSGNTFKDHSIIGPFFVGCPLRESSNLTLFLGKTGDNGWHFKVSVAGVQQNGELIQLVDENQDADFVFDGDTQSTFFSLS